MAIPDKVAELVERFQENESAYRSPDYKEAHIRQDFIDPLFAALGWDLRNEQNTSELYKEVIFEDAIKIGGSTKAPDYCFRLGGNRKFFVEAKKPSVNLADSVSAAFQVRRYGWSAKLPVSILTDFEEFAVYDCRVIPNKNDKSSTARSLYLKYGEYADRWNEIYDLFSKEAVLAGALEQYADETKPRKGSTTVDAAFLKEIEGWRERLAIALFQHNPNLSQRDLNFAVQMTINRLIFLRICEDRGIEPYEQLRSLTQQGNVYEQLTQIFRKADDRYNSGLFHFKSEKGRSDADEFTLTLTIPDAPLQQIIQNFYYPDSPYEFSVIPIEILGQVYEQFLGKVIRLTPTQEAVVEDKPEVRKAGGVYYTPTYIVDYIVQNTVGRLLDGKTPKQAEKIRVLDPACGSGSFLIGAYQFLLNWYLQQYSAEPTKYKKQLYQGMGGDWRLTSDAKKKILLDHIYGVDIDLQAVETTKLSLLLKVLEGESDETLKKQLSLFQERALPDLEKNIKCGNSLIGSDYYDQVQMSLMSEDEIYQVNVFDWEEGFPEIMQSGGFDAVIGNPPYVRQEILGQGFKDYAKNRFRTYTGMADLYVFFFEKSHHLLKKDGFFSMICSNKFMRSNYGVELREFLSSKTQLIQIIDFGELPVFQNAATFPSIFITRNKEVQKQKFVYAPIESLKFRSLLDEVEQIGFDLDNSSLSRDNWTLAENSYLAILDKIEKHGLKLGELIGDSIYRGVVTGLNKVFVITDEVKNTLISQDPKSIELIKPYLMGDDIRKYQINFRDRYLIFARRGVDIEAYPAIYQYLRGFQESLEPKPKDWTGEGWKGRKSGSYKWYEIQDAIDFYTEFDKPKIVYPDIAKASRFAFDSEGRYVADTTFIIPSSNLYLLGILNSSTTFFYLKKICPVLGDADYGGRLRLKTIYIKQLPIRVIDFDNPTDKTKHDRMVQLVDQMLTLHKQFADANTPPQKSLIQKQINVCDRQIDQLVYELYELTPEEIAIVEGR